MAIEKTSTPFDVEVMANPDEATIEVGVETQEFEVEGEDVTVDLGGGEEADQGDEFGANLAESMDETDLQSLSSDLLVDFQNDLTSRDEWEKTYRNGLDLLGLRIEERTEPWDGACGVFHPLITEAVVKFQAEAMTETFPASGPVKTQVMGKVTPDVERRASRVRDDMNYWLTHKIKDYRAEHERLLWSLSLCGSAFKKVYADPISGMPRAMFVPGEDLVVPYGCSDLYAAQRYAHVMKKTKNDIRKLQVAGFYRDIDLGEPVQEQSALKQKKDKLSNQKLSVVDDRHTLLEMHVDLDLPGHEDKDGIELPYVVTINKSNGTILSIYRNWDENDPNKTKRMHFVHFPFVPGFGFYGYGWVHLLGNTSKAATSLLRQLVDAGTLSNLPGGLKARGLRIKSEDTPISPGEWRDVDIPGGKIQDSVMALPYKEPSTTLYQLLVLIVDEGRRLAGITDMKVQDLNKETPVGTTLAILERTLKVMNAIQARLHAAMREEFELLAKIIKNNTPPEYEYEVEGGTRQIKQEDYSDEVDILPVSDPNATTMAQRIVQYQAALQLSQQAPELYNRPQIHRDMLTVLGIRNVEKILPMGDEMQPTDPISENMNILTGKPVKVFMHEDHDAHISAHMSMAQNPKILAMIGQSPSAGIIKGAFASHVTEHIAHSYRTRVERELGTALPPPGAPLPPEVEANLSALVAKASAKVLGKDQAEAQAQKIVAMNEDPVIQLQKAELAIDAAEVERKKEADERKFSLDEIRMVLDYLKSKEETASRELTEGLKTGVEAVQAAQDREVKRDIETKKAKAKRNSGS